jgi:hypothetical protein
MPDAPIEQPTAEPAAEPAAPPVGSLLDAAAAPAPVADPAAPKGEAPAAEAPEWFRKDKYKTVEDQAKAYVELEKKLGSFIGAPEDYELSLPEGVADLSTDDLGFDDRLSAVRDVAKELNMSQDGFTKLVHAFIAADQQMNTVHVERELAALGPDAPARISDVSTFYAKAFGEDDFMTVREIARTAEGVQFLERAMQKMRNTSTIPATVTAATATQSEQQWRDSVDWKRYESDKTYRELRLADLRRIVGS